jgi:hypothetical protein
MEEQQWASLVGPGGGSAAAAAWGATWLRLIDWEESAGRARRAEMWALTGGWRDVGKLQVLGAYGLVGRMWAGYRSWAFTGITLQAKVAAVIRLCAANCA